MFVRAMNDVLAIGGTMLIRRRLVPDSALIVRDGRIEYVGALKDVDVPRGTRWIADEGGIVAPGFIDIHIHGSGGCHSEDDVAGMARHIIGNGTTLFLPTVMTDELDKMVAAAERISSVVGHVKGGATVGGVHLEGPFLNPRYGAQIAGHNIEPTPESISRLIGACGGRPRMVTLAPERRGAVKAIQAFRGTGATVAIGHSDAGEEEYQQGREAGISHATHLFNAMPPADWLTAQTYRGRKPVGTEELLLADDGISADVVCDTECAHIHSSLLRIAIKCKGMERLALITDAMPAAGLPPGEHRLTDGRSVFTVPGNDIVRLDDGLLCGSAMTMKGAVWNWMRHTGASPAQALTMASEAPARAIGEFDRRGSIEPGKEADIVWLTPDFQVRRVMIHGSVEYQSK